MSNARDSLSTSSVISTGHHRTIRGPAASGRRAASLSTPMPKGSAWFVLLAAHASTNRDSVRSEDAPHTRWIGQDYVPSSRSTRPSSLDNAVPRITSTLTRASLKRQLSARPRPAHQGPIQRSPLRKRYPSAGGRTTTATPPAASTPVRFMVYDITCYSIAWCERMSLSDEAWRRSSWHRL